MNQIGKLDRVLDEKDGNVVPDDVPVALLACTASPRSRAHPARDPLNPCCRQRSRSAQTPASSRLRAGKDRRGSAPPATRSSRSSRERRILAHARPARESVHDRNGRSSRENEDLRAAPVHEARGAAYFDRPRWACPAASLRRAHLFRPSGAVQPAAGSQPECFAGEACFVLLSVFHKFLTFTLSPLPVSRAAHRDRRLLRRPPLSATGERP